ncbi:IS5 family transposase [Dysgonomonas sp. Marseille-P4677]|uniref:IS5 family transposase n=1 Tax=Dysgonomonas sp. Marseille-P4677 TaxID=2364790 RepID=UPI001914395D|nr:IS5 family transposase [Dysgonomonas sp. Marseille-P4677]MBK5719838.1 IS5 family transposase [Dysgonomonas sp. Marseille-P4677]
MLRPSKNDAQQSLFFSLGGSLDQKHPLYILAFKVDWDIFEREFSKFYSADEGVPSKLIRLMVVLLILKYIRNLSDERLVEQWSENIYYKYLCGQNKFIVKIPCVTTELVMFRQRIGVKGCELILCESIHINGKDGNEPDISADTTVQEKNITYPTDNKLHRKIIAKCKKITNQENIIPRQAYTHTLKKLYVDIRFSNHPKNKKKSCAGGRKIRTIVGRLAQELERKLPDNYNYSESLNLFTRVFNQKRSDKNKIHSLHEPPVHCISKGEEHKKHESGKMASTLYTQSARVTVGALSFKNEYVATLPKALEQYKRLKKKPPKNVFASRGYKGKTVIVETSIHIAKPFSKKLNTYQQQKRKESHNRRAAIEPIIGHLKQDHRLSGNFYKGDFGDAINVLLAASVFNFKRMINKYKQKIVYIRVEIQAICFYKLVAKVSF